VPRVEFPVPCPHCGRTIPLAPDALRPGTSAVCPGCGGKVTFQETGAERLRHAFDLLRERVKRLKVKVTLRRNS
jgi:DNA-directed RNA polymerase subunit RPC12/RpoP